MPKYPSEPHYFCYQCDKEVLYLFADGRGSCCTRLTKDEIEGNVDPDPCGYCGDSNDPNDICKSCWDNMKGAFHGQQS